jgi:hypothetical protein
MVDTEEPKSQQDTATAVEAATEQEPVTGGEAATATGVTTNPILPEVSEEPYRMIDIVVPNEAPAQPEASAPAKDEATSGSTDPAAQVDDEPGADALQIWALADPDVLSVSRINRRL